MKIKVKVESTELNSEFVTMSISGTFSRGEMDKTIKKIVQSFATTECFRLDSEIKKLQNQYSFFASLGQKLDKTI